MTGASWSRKTLPVVAFFAIGLAVAGCQTPAATTAQDGEATSPATKIGQSLLDAAKEAERQGDFTSAARYYRNVHKRNPDNAAALVGLSRSLRNLNRAAEAEAILGRALSDADRDPELLSELGKVQVALGKPLEAIESLSKAISLGASRWDIETALAVAYDRIGMYDKAERRYQNALSQNPGNAVVFNNFGLSRAQAGDLDGAVGLLEKAVALPESTSRMRQNLALLYAIRGDLSAAESLVSRDLSAGDAKANMAYYRRLRQSVTQDGGRPRLPDLGTSAGAGPDVGSVVGDAAPASDGRAGEAVVAAAPREPVKTAPAEPKPPMTKREEEAAKSGESGKNPWNKVAKPGADESASSVMSKDPAPAAGAAADDNGTPHALTPDADKPAPSAPAKAETMAPKDADKTAGDAGEKMAAKQETAKAPTAAPPSSTPPKSSARSSSDTAKMAAKSDTSPPAATTSIIRHDDDGRYAVQLGSFREAHRAEQHGARVGSELGDLLHDLQLSVVEAEVEGKGTFYRVVAGRIAVYKDAQRLCADLKTRDVGCLVVRAR